MKITLDIPNERLQALLEVTRTRTHTEAINTAINEYIHRKNIDAILALEGSGGFVRPEELKEIRELELKEK